MTATIKGVETLFKSEAMGEDNIGQYVDLLGYDGGKDAAPQRFRLYVGETFHIAYQGKLGFLEFLWGWLTGAELALPSYERCNCRWEHRKNDE